MAVFIPITGIKTDAGGGDQSSSDQGHRRQLTVFTASAFSTLQPQTPPQSSGRGRKRACSMKTELSVTGALNGDLHQGMAPGSLKQKIPRPPNAFMLFANDWRRKLASQFPKESNKDISIRLGGMWKNMEKDEKEKYFQFARDVDAAHKKKYPDYVYNPKEARMRKALREQSRGERQAGGGSGQAGGGGSGQHRAGGGPAPWGKHRHIMNHRQPIMVGEQPLHHHHPHHHLQSSVQRGGGGGAPDDVVLGCKLDTSGAGGAGAMIQNFSDYLNDLSSSYPATAAISPQSEFIVPDLDQSWYSYVQGPVQNATTYLMRAPPDKVVSSSEWGTHFAAENTSFIHSSNQNGTENGDNGFLGSVSTIGSRDQHQLVNGSASGHQMPTHQIGSPITDKQAIVVHDQTNNNDIKNSVLGDSKSLMEMSQIKAGSQNGLDSGISKDALRLPGFQQAFGSTEIGRFSQHEGFFEASIPQPEAQPEPKNIPDPVTPPRNKLPDVDFHNPGSYILSPGTNMSPSMWGPLLYSPPTMKDGTSTSCFGSPTFPQQSPLTNFIDYSLLSGTEFMQSNNDEIIDISSHCSTNDHSTATGSSSLYSAEEKELQILLAANTSSTDTGNNNNHNSRNTDCTNAFGNAIKPLQRIIDINTNNADKSLGLLELCRKAQQGTITIGAQRQDANNNPNRIRSGEEFANQDLKMNCVNQPPVIISENEKICVILESSNVGLDSCRPATSNNSNLTNNKQFTSL